MAGRGGTTRTSGQGRKPGVPNKLGRDIKEMVVGALCAAGGVNYLLRQAEQNPVAFMGLVGRVLPLQVTGEAGGPIHFSFDWAPAQSVDTPVDTPVIDADTSPEIEWDHADDVC
jgi:hypothetical protein